MLSSEWIQFAAAVSLLYVIIFATGVALFLGG